VFATRSVVCALLIALAPVCGAQPPPDAAQSVEIDTFNYVLGTQTIGKAYQLTDKPFLVETAEAIHQMGSNLLKIAMSSRSYGKNYGLKRRDDIRSLADMATREPSVKAVLDMPFGIYQIWAYCFTSGWWADGLSEAERAAEYEEMYAFARHLLRTYNGSGKTFLLGHWEGDWHLHRNYDRKKDPSPERIQGMIEWLNTRQKAIDDAKRDVGHSDVALYHYTEVNLVQKAISGGVCLTNNVLPHVDVDYVSYSSYDTINNVRGNAREKLHEALDYVESKLPPKDGVPGRRVFIGEYGYPLTSRQVGSAEKQDEYARDLCRAALEWGCPYVLFWEMYCNCDEYKETGKHRGMWLIDDTGRKQPFYYTLQRYYGQSREYIAEFRKTHGRAPTADEFRHRAVEFLFDSGG
jgi:hypothetical protein